MNKTSDYKLHPYCFISALPDTKVLMPLIDCTQQANLAEVHNDDGFIYSEYKHDGASEPLKVGYRLPEVISPASADTFLAEVLVEDVAGHTYGSIVGGTILSPTKFKPAIYIQCGDRACGGDPRIVDGSKAGLTYTTAATMKLCLNPELRQEVHLAASDNPPSWNSHCAFYSPEVVTTLSGDSAVCDDPTKQAGKMTSYFDLVTDVVKLIEVEIDDSKLVMAA